MPSDYDLYSDLDNLYSPKRKRMTKLKFCCGSGEAVSKYVCLQLVSYMTWIGYGWRPPSIAKIDCRAGALTVFSNQTRDSLKSRGLKSSFPRRFCNASNSVCFLPNGAVGGPKCLHLRVHRRLLRCVTRSRGYRSWSWRPISSTGSS